MGIFTRFKDIISSNISSMLDSAEDPDKLIRLMLREMEETLVELKAGCAATMAEAAQVRRCLEEAGQTCALWDRRAELALRARREDMAQEAAAERLAAQKRVDALEREVRGFDDLVDKCRRDIVMLEERIVSTRDKQRLLGERRQQAKTRRQAREQVRAADALDAMRRFEDLEQRISRMEYEAELAYTAPTANSDFKGLERSADIAATLDQIRACIGETLKA
jgi:phage shock protein A